MLKNRSAAFVCGLCAALLAAAIAISAVLSDLAARREVRQDVVRLHVIANSDTETDQRVKLMVRDAVLKAGAEAFYGAESARQAVRALAPRLHAMEAAANRVLRANGCAYGAKAELTSEYFTARAYDTFTLPAGRYTAVKITLGQAEGKNWWCVMFPPLCLPAAGPEDAAAVFSDDEMRVLRPEKGFQVRFKLAEWLEDLWNAWEGGV